MEDDANVLLQKIFAVARPYCKGRVREERIRLNPNLYVAYDDADHVIAFYGEAFRNAAAKIASHA